MKNRKRHTARKNALRDFVKYLVALSAIGVAFGMWLATGIETGQAVKKNITAVVEWSQTDSPTVVASAKTPQPEVSTPAPAPAPVINPTVAEQAAPIVIEEPAPAIAEQSIDVPGKGNVEVVIGDDEQSTTPPAIIGYKEVKEKSITAVAEQAAPEAEEKPEVEVSKVLFEREPGSQLYRDPHLMSAADIFTLITNPAFYDPDAVSGVEDPVKKAKAHLNELFATGKLKRLLTPEQIIAIALREACDDDEKLLVDINCTGDRHHSTLEQARGVMQISLRAADSVDAIDGFGIKMGDFLGDIALSEMVFQAWVFEHLTHRDDPNKVFEWASRNWNGGPTGSTDPDHRYYQKAYRYFHGDSRPGVFGNSNSGELGYYPRVLQLDAVIAFRTPKKEPVVQQVAVKEVAKVTPPAAAPQSVVKVETPKPASAPVAKREVAKVVERGFLEQLTAYASTAWTYWSQQWWPSDEEAPIMVASTPPAASGTPVVTGTSSLTSRGVSPKKAPVVFSGLYDPAKWENVFWLKKPEPTTPSPEVALMEVLYRANHYYLDDEDVVPKGQPTAPAGFFPAMAVNSGLFPPVHVAAALNEYERSRKWIDPRRIAETKSEMGTPTELASTPEPVPAPGALQFYGPQ